MILPAWAPRTPRAIVARMRTPLHAARPVPCASIAAFAFAFACGLAVPACPASPRVGGEGEGEGAVGEGEGEGEGGPLVEPGDPGPADVQLAVRVDTARRSISPLVYGQNGDDGASADGVALTRSGGNRLTAYNWENNASNAGSDYCNQNDGTMGTASDPPANAFAGLLDDAQARGTSVLLTVPLVDVVAADTDDLGDGGQGPPACIGDVIHSGADYLTTRFVANHAKKSAPFADPPDTSDGAVFQDELVAYVKSHWPAVPLFVSTDNEPDLWSSTHPRIHPDPVTYAELASRTAALAGAVKDVSPDVGVFAFVSYGYTGYITLQNAPDSSADGDAINFFLDAMAAQEQAQGRRIVDVLDLHWYPEARGDGVRVSDVEDATGAAARVQAPRSLWDPSYSEDSFIVTDVLHAPITLLPTLFAQIDAHYPGTKLSFSEWNYGGGNDISGALAVADVLGVFGQQGVFASTFFPLNGPEPFNHAGLRAYRNFDGAGASFGATSVSATTSDVERVTVYASDDPLVVVAINKSAVDIDAALTLAAPATAHLRRFVLDGSAPVIAAAAGVDATVQNAFHVALPASTVTVLAP